MNREERIRAAIAGKEVDRVPVNVWMHLSNFDQDPVSLAEETVAYNERYDYDFIKMMPFGMYSVQDYGAKLAIYSQKGRPPIWIGSIVQTPEDYLAMEPLPATYGTYGKQLQFAQYLSKMVKPNTPFIQTLFSPLTSLCKLVGTEKVYSDIKTHPAEVRHALEVLTETTKTFAKANIEAGVSGFFFASQNAQKEALSDEEFMEFAQKYDLQVINSYKDITWFNVVHIHGSGNVRFEEFANYPVNVINWHDRNTAPAMADARKLSDKCFLGGIMETPVIINGESHPQCYLTTNDKEHIHQHIREAIDAAGKAKLIIGPGCVADPATSDEQLLAARSAVDNY